MSLKIAEPDYDNIIANLHDQVRKLEAALKKCADKLERCALAGGTTPEYAAIAVEEFRALGGG